MLQGAAAERGLVVAIEDAGERLDVERQVGDERQLDALFLQPFAAQEIAHDVRPIDPGQIVLVDLVGPPEPVAHLAESRLGAERQREKCEVGFSQVNAGLLPGCFFPRFDSDDRGSVRIDLAEERELDLTRKEAVLLPGEGSAACSRDVALRDVAYEVTGDPYVEQEVTRAPLLVEREGLSRPRQVHR